MTRRYHLHLPGLMYIGLTLMVAVIAMNRQNNLLFAILGMLLAALLISGVVSWLMMRGLRVRRLVPRDGAVGEPLAVRYAVTNRNRIFPVFNIHIEERPVAGPSGWAHLMAPAQTWVLHIGPKETVHGEAIFWPSRRGEARFDRLRVWTTFPFGIVKKSITNSRPQHALIYPLLYELRRNVVNDVAPQGLAGAKISQRARDPVAGDDYYGMREFRPGDSLRHIAWKRSAALDQLVCIERTRPAPPRLRVVVNLTTPTAELRVDPADEHSPRQLEELAISLAASIIHAADRNGFEVGLSLPGTGLPSHLIRHSPWHRAKMLAALAGIDLDAPRPADPVQAATSAERVGQIVIHPDRVEPSIGRANAWHLTARQMNSLVLRSIGWDPHEAPPSARPGQRREAAA
ncbi:MAG: DUF58 domain-containing protein [Phycisphaerales bacterium]